MDKRIRCFLLEPSEMAEKSFRRFAKIHYLENPDGSFLLDEHEAVTLDPAYDAENKCPGPMSYHNAVVLIEPILLSLVSVGKLPNKEELIDPRWSRVCEWCGYVFQDFDCWQVDIQRLYRRSDTQELIPLRRAPVGAMWDASWMAERYKGPDGKCLVLRTPGGDWTIDGHAQNSEKWERTGSPPDITATPSVLIGEVTTGEGRVISSGYHGWLKNGWLEEL